MTSLQILYSFFYFVFATVVLHVTIRRMDDALKAMVWICYMSQLTIALLFYPVEHYILGGGGDIDLYLDYGGRLYYLMKSDIVRWFPAVFEVAIRGTPYLPFEIVLKGSSTGANSAWTAFLFLLTGGPSVIAGSWLMGILTFFSRFTIFLCIRKMSHEKFHAILALMICGIPSVTFWCSSFLKESFAMVGVGMIFAGTYIIIERRKFIYGLVLLIFGVIPLYSLKSFFILPLSVSTVGWVYLKHKKSTRQEVRFLDVIKSLFLPLIAVLFIGIIFPEYSVKHFLVEAQREFEVFQIVNQRSGSSVHYYYWDNIFLLVPQALFTVLFRPVIFEASSLSVLAASLESTILMLMMVYGIYRRGLMKTYQMLLSTPILFYCAILTLVGSIGIGVAVPNLGSISRYRVPITPFYFTLVSAMFIYRKEYYKK